MLENIVMCKIAHFCTFVCAILTNFVRDFDVLTKYKPIDSKIAHSMPKYCVILLFNVLNHASRGPNPIPGGGWWVHSDTGAAGGSILIQGRPVGTF